jgi:hypothetical protein
MLYSQAASFGNGIFQNFKFYKDNRKDHVLIIIFSF